MMVLSQHNTFVAMSGWWIVMVEVDQKPVSILEGHDETGDSQSVKLGLVHHEYR